MDNEKTLMGDGEVLKSQVKGCAIRYMGGGEGGLEFLLIFFTSARIFFFWVGDVRFCRMCAFPVFFASISWFILVNIFYINSVNIFFPSFYAHVEKRKVGHSDSSSLI